MKKFEICSRNQLTAAIMTVRFKDASLWHTLWSRYFPLKTLSNISCTCIQHSVRFINLRNENALVDTIELQLCYSKAKDCRSLSGKSLKVSWTKLFCSISHVNKDAEEKVRSNRLCQLQTNLFLSSALLCGVDWLYEEVMRAFTFE